ncbi:MAG: hypothetical protein AMJ65_03535 [Phycisphaerae bacterium SG8_4]|nr:MAG: hypothetical protein AMJ65_03535 [Phycisphaerae bacterium SG8_4]
MSADARAPLILLLLLTVVTGRAAAQGMADVELVPHPDLDELKPEVRDALRGSARSSKGVTSGWLTAGWASTI